MARAARLKIAGGSQNAWLLVLKPRQGYSSLSLSLYVDTHAVVFWGCVSLIAASVFMFSSTYIKNEIYFARFHWLVMVFVIAILAFIRRGNILTMLVGWDGLGVTSFLLVIFFNRKKAINSGLLTFFVNRLGDSLILRSLGIIL